MTTRHRLQAEQSIRDYTRRHQSRPIAAVLGNNAGTVAHITRENWVYVRLHGDQNQVVPARNDNKVSSEDAAAGLAVDVELVHRTAASYYQVIGLSSGINYPSTPWPGSVGAHAAQHQRRDFGAGGSDPLDVYTRAMVETRARAQATPDLTLYIEIGWYDNAGQRTKWAGGNSPAFSLPSGSFFTAGRRIDLLYIADDDTAKIAQGTPTSDGSTPSYPATPADCCKPLAMVWLDSGMTAITESYIEDARILGSATPGAVQAAAPADAQYLLGAADGDLPNGIIFPAGDIGGTAASPEVIALRTTEIDPALAPLAGQTLVWGTAGWTAGAAQGYTVQYYLHDAASDIGGYKVMDTTFPTGPAVGYSTTCTKILEDPPDSLVSFATPAGVPGINYLAGGIFYAAVAASVQTAGAGDGIRFRFALYSRTSGGTETLLDECYTENTLYDASPTYAEANSGTSTGKVIVATGLNLTDRLVLKVKVNKIGPDSPIAFTYWLDADDAGIPSYFSSSIPAAGGGVLGTAGGDLSGTYPNPSVVDDSHDHTQSTSHGTPDTDSAPTALHHTLGTGANNACAGNDARLSNARTPSAHDVLSAAHGDTLAASVSEDDVLVGNATPKWARLAVGTDGQVLTVDPVTHHVSWQDNSGGGLADPGSNGIVTRTALNTTGVAVASDVVGLFSGSGDYLKTDGTQGTPTGAALTVKEEDGSPSVSSVTEIKFPNGSVTDNTGGSVSIAIAATDSAAIHDNVAGEINAITEKATPVDADLLIIEDSEDSNNKKKLQVGSLPGGGMADPGSNGIVTRTALNTTGIAAASDVTGLFSGAGDYLKSDGTKGTPATAAMVHQAVFTFAGNLSAGAGTIRIYNKTGASVTVSQVFLAANTAPANQAIIVDVNKNGVTLFTTQGNRPQIAAAANTGYSTTLDVTSLADGDYLTADIDQIGTGTTGADLTVHVIYS